MRRIFPGARFVHLVRDGRDVAISAREQWRGGRSDTEERDASPIARLREWLATIIREVREREMLETMRLHQLPYYALRALKLLRSRLTGQSTLWGPKVERLKEISEQYSVLETCAWQWQACLQRVEEDWQDIPRERRTEIHYESLLEAPREEVERILRLVELDLTSEVEGRLQQVRSDNSSKWRSRLNGGDIERVEAIIGDTLERYGYELATIR